MPLNFIKNSPYFANFPAFFNVEVNIAKKIIITHCPAAKEKRSAIENRMFDETAANANIAAKTGEEQGLAANANAHPTVNGNKKVLPFLFSGIFLIKDGNENSSKPMRFNPKHKINEAKIINITGEAKPTKALPVRAQITPIMLKTDDKPSEKASI